HHTPHSTALLPPLSHPPTSTPLPYTTLFPSDHATPPDRHRRGRTDDLVARRSRRSPALVPRLHPGRAGGPQRLLRVQDEVAVPRSEEHTSELQSRVDIVCCLLIVT